MPPSTASDPPPLRVAIASTPRLLADSLRVALAGEGVDVWIVLEPTDEHFDVAVVSPDGPPVAAKLVLVLDDRSEGGPIAESFGADGEPVIVIDSFKDLTWLVRRLAAARQQTRVGRTGPTGINRP